MIILLESMCCRKPCFLFVSDRSASSVLIVGDSIVYWAGRQAELEGEPAMGLVASVTWEGRRGLQLRYVPDVVRSLLRRDNTLNPAYILLHAGTNDIGRAQKHELRKLVQDTFQRVHELLPQTRIVWSEILPRRAYRGFSREEQPKIERVRLSMNKLARAVCRRTGDVTVGHPSIRHEKEYLYRNDGIHLSETGIQVFLGSIMPWRA